MSKSDDERVALVVRVRKTGSRVGPYELASVLESFVGPFYTVEYANRTPDTPTMREALEAVRDQVECYCLDEPEARGRTCAACLARAALTAAGVEQ